ncbi:hypothetical protein LCGC14_1429670 [marine sediment metagenome]|uniref:Uncharacterized protein n=1 Tax=marine sediment metagenome TaxID=412755 RepID=A0A0F9M4G4_9ZZZZ
MAKKMKQTKQLTESGVISAVGKSALVWAMTLFVGVDKSSIVLKDGGSSGTEKWKLSFNSDLEMEAGDFMRTIEFDRPIICSTDAFGTLVGTDAEAYIVYDEIEA